MKTAFVICLVAFILVLQGCASSSVLVGKARPAISPDKVKLYLTPPAKYEEVALLEASGEYSWAFTNQSQMNAVIDLLKEEAAKLGANGILIRTTGEGSSGYAGSVVGTGKSAVFVGSSAMYKSGTGIAIFVITE